MRDKDAHLMMEALRLQEDSLDDQLDDAGNVIQPDNLSQRIDALEAEVAQLKVTVDKNNLKGLIMSVLGTVFPWAFAGGKPIQDPKILLQDPNIRR
tara:strand:+ start:348 stop:635 length:288 start_codon:yes stop_codon:yes gene_type:complete